MSVLNDDFRDAKPVQPTSEAKDDRLNDAVLLGATCAEMEALLDRPATLLSGQQGGTARNTQDGDWKASTKTWGQWIAGAEGTKSAPAWGFSRHPVGKDKEGACIVLGASVEGARKAHAMTDMYAIGLDIDSGVSLDSVLDKLEELGLFALVYTSYNHGRAGLALKRDEVLRKLGIKTDPTLAQVQEYLRAHGRNRYEDDFIANVAIKEQKHQTATGVKILLDSPPVDKFRLIFPLAEPVKLIDLAATQADALTVWEDKVTGLARNVLGVHFDTSCTDPSRLFYTARHPKGAKAYCAVVQGRPLRFEDVPAMKKSAYTRERGTANLSPWEIACGVTGDRPPAAVAPSGAPLNDWHRAHKDRFQIADLLEHYCPERIRVAGGEAQGTVHVECPFEHEHSKEGGTATMAINAPDSTSGYWTWFCHHDACQGRHKLAFLEEALRQEWFPEDVLTDLKQGFVLPPEDGDEEAHEADSALEQARFEPRKDWLPSGYKVSGGTVYRMGGEDEGDKPLCQAFDVVGTAANLAGNGDAGVIIHFQNRFGTEVEVTLSFSDLTSPTGGGVLEDLAGMGMRIFTRAKSDRDSLLDLFCRMTPRRHSPTVPRPGWVRDGGGNVLGFMLPSGQYIEAEPANPFRLASVATMKDSGTAGTLEGWKKAANAALAHDRNFYWGWGVCAAFVGPLLSLTDLPACGFNLSGDSSMGKTLALLLGCAAWGATASKRGTFFKLNSTLNAMEDLASVGSETFMGLDEISMMQNPKALAEMLFALAEGTGKSRKAGRGRGLAEDAEYRPFIGLTNERTLRTVIENAGGDYKTGISVRFPDISVGDGARVSAAEIKVLEDVTRNYGHAGPTFVRWLIANDWHRRGHDLRKAVDEAAASLAGDASPAQARAARIFALVQIAGEKACEAGLLADVAKVRGAVVTAWNAFKASDEGKATEGEASLLDGFRGWLVRAFGVSVMDVSDDSTRSYRDLKGWYDEDKIVLIADTLNDMKAMGLNGTRAALLRALEDAGALELSGKNRTHNKLPKGIGAGDVPNVRILRDKLGLPHIPKGLGVAL